jgi:uncharacterized protein (DUF305 family)
MHIHTLAFVLAVGVPGVQAPPTPPNPQIVQPGKPGEASKVIEAGKAAEMPRPTYSAPDVKFMQGMIGHHLQALEMTALLYPRTKRADMKLLAKRIDVSQTDEVRMMRRWLADRAQDVPGEHAHHSGMLMPGMLTPEEMKTLAAAKGPQFDRLFLEGMIKHHGGALVMVEELFASPGAAQDSDIYAFASDVVADQRMEMDRMAGMLSVMPKERKQ